MEEHARAWLASLDDAQRRMARQPFAARTDWHYVPRARPGLPLRRMDAAQRDAAWRLVETALSAAGRRKAEAVPALERVLGELEDRPAYRDPDNYALAVYGEPRRDAPWAWRIEGHHLSLACTLVPGAGTAVTPAFFGANPAVVPPHHARAGDELLATERALAFELVASLAGARRERCLIAADAPRDILTGPGHERRLAQAEGVPFADLADGERGLGWRLVQAFLRHLRDDLRDREEGRIREAGLERLHFAWAGSTALGAPHYFRLHGPRTVVEYDNVQNGANHVHTVWHDPIDVFGDDRLARHHREGHHAGRA